LHSPFPPRYRLSPPTVLQPFDSRPLLFNIPCTEHRLPLPTVNRCPRRFLLISRFLTRRVPVFPPFFPLRFRLPFFHFLRLLVFLIGVQPNTKSPAMENVSPLPLPDLVEGRYPFFSRSPPLTPTCVPRPLHVLNLPPLCLVWSLFPPPF